MATSCAHVYQRRAIDRHRRFALIVELLGSFRHGRLNAHAAGQVDKIERRSRQVKHILCRVTQWRVGHSRHFALQYGVSTVIDDDRQDV